MAVCTDIGTLKMIKTSKPERRASGTPADDWQDIGPKCTDKSML